MQCHEQEQADVLAIEALCCGRGEALVRLGLRLRLRLRLRVRVRVRVRVKVRVRVRVRVRVTSVATRDLKLDRISKWRFISVPSTMWHTC